MYSLKGHRMVGGNFNEENLVNKMVIATICLANKRFLRWLLKV